MSKGKNLIKKILTTLTLVATLSVTAFAGNLSDISANKNQVAIQYLYTNNVISGYPDGTFKPDNTVNRAELLKILVGGKGIQPTVEEYNNCFPDVKEEWFAPFVCYAKKQGWVGGYPDGTFQPGKEVNKAEAIKMLVNSQAYTVPEAVSETLFNDVKNSDWFAPFLKVAKEKGLLEETGGTYSPSGVMKRSGISENIYRAMIINENDLQSFSEFKSDDYLVTNVVDGDTIDVAMNGETVRIRLIGADTPETVHPSKPVECFGKEASAVTKEKLLNQMVKLESDPTQGDKDNYDRLLRYVILADGTNFNKWLIDEGYAFEYTYNIPYAYQEAFMQAETDAENGKAGLWADDACNETTNPEDTDSTTSTSGDYTFYLSSKAKSKYYCATDPAWENLSKDNLLEYSSEAELKADYPNLELNQPC